MSSNSFFTSEKFVRPAISAGVAMTLDRVILGNNDIKKNLMFGASVGTGIALGTMAGSMVIPDSLDTALTFGNGKQIGTRAIELGVSGITSYVVTRYILKESDKSNIIRKIGVILISDVAGEIACDYLSGRNISYSS